MNLDDAELEIALMALHHLEKHARERQLGVTAHFCCGHVARKVDALVARIEQHQKDRENGDAR